MNFPGYLQAYTTALKNQPFQLMYIDAFAGRGYRAVRQKGETVHGFFSLPQMTALAKGSARRALEVDPAFDHYIFIEANPGRFHELVQLEEDFASMRDCLTFKNQEANAAIAKICRDTDWRRTRAVLFLDPYGMQVNWTTIQAIGAVRHIDLWYLFPVGTVQRLLQREGRISAGWETALDRFWATRAGEPSSTRRSVNRRSSAIEHGRVRSPIYRRSSAMYASAFSRLSAAVLHEVLCSYVTLKAAACICFFLHAVIRSPKAHGLALKIAQHVLKS